MNEKLAREIVKDRSGDVCERCGSARATNMHHRKNRSQGGKWTPANLLHLCGSGTTGCHGAIGENRNGSSYGQGWLVRRNEESADVPVWVFGWGFVLLADNGNIMRVDEGSDDIH